MTSIFLILLFNNLKLVDMKGKNLVMIVIVFALMGLNILKGQITFQKAYGGSHIDGGSSMRQTADGGYIIIGTTMSFGAGNRNIYLIRTDKFGDTIFVKTYGGTSTDEGNDVQQTTDGGFILVGNTESFGAGSNDVYLIRTDSLGDTLWTKAYGGTNDDEGNSVEQTIDGGFIITGTTFSFGAGYNDVYLIKTNSIGDTMWTKTIGGIGFETGNSIEKTNDGGYIICGSTSSYGAGGEDVFLIKIDSIGSLTWSKTFGGIDDDGGGSYASGNTVKQTINGGYIIVSTTRSFGAGGGDIYIIRTNSNGDTLYTRSFGTVYDDSGFSIQQTNDGGYIITGDTYPGPGIYLIRTDSLLNILWSTETNYGGMEHGSCVLQTLDQGYIVCGSTNELGPQHNGNVFLTKTDALGHSHGVGCGEQNITTVITLPQTIVTSPSPIISHGGIISPTQTIIKNGDTITSLCTHYCSAQFYLYLDSFMIYHYWIENIEFGTGPLRYNWNWGDGHHDTIPFPSHIYADTGMHYICLTITDSIGCSSTYCDSANLSHWVNVISPLETKIKEINKNSNSIHLSPNPFTTTTTLTLQGTCHNPSLFIYNLLGQEIRNIPVGTNTQLTINRERLASGMYFYKVIDENKEVIGIGKMIVE
jgi:hypothetical protein